ncbi:MAG: type III-A CRISPR-associated protein Cas10/Csm1, partial [Deltaproteobacteria bacterium]|nr:type III-A CRISPR-associated protein Cas10/Csm1 [Deltaproteobacteria bacterium]
AAWLEEQYGGGLLTALVRTHHGHTPETWKANLSLIGYEADNCAASERKKYDPDADRRWEWQARIPLVNIFGRIRDPRQYKDPGKPPPLPPPSYLALGALGSWQPPAHEEPKNSPERYRELWEQFTGEFEVLRKKGLHHEVEIVLSLLEKYLTSVPSITQKIYGADDEETYRKHPDVSLFDHLKMAAALGHCLLNYYREKYPGDFDQRVLTAEITGPDTWDKDAPAPFLAVGGDISGVQRFIYTISSTGALKGLKGRSFFLELFTEHVVDHLLAALELTRANVIFTGGGHFYLLAPNTAAAQDAVALVRRTANDFLWTEFNGVLQLFLEAEPLNKKQLAAVGQVWGQLSARLEWAKRRRWDDRLAELMAEPASPHPDCFTDKCGVCAREDRELIQAKLPGEDISMCPPCHDQFRLGERLQNALREARGFPVIGVYRSPPPGTERLLVIKTQGWERCYLPARDAGALPGTPEVIYHLNNWEIHHFPGASSRLLLSSTYHPREFRDLETLVKEGFGMEQAAVFRLDVDFLGRVMSGSLEGEDDTLARKASLSRQVNLFFKGHLDGILTGQGRSYETLPRANLAGRQGGPRRLSVIYAGGDDLFILGHWLDVLEAALDINQAFGRFTLNPYLTVSAGLVMAPANHPLYRLADLAKEGEEEAKSAGGDEKNRLGLGREKVFSWPQLDKDVRPAVELLSGLLAMDQGGNRLAPVKDGVGQGFFYRLLQLCRDQRRRGAWRFPALAWVFGRQQPRNQELLNPWMNLRNYVFNTGVNWQGLETALQWILMMTRKGE